MLTPDKLVKLALEYNEPEPEVKPVRKAVDAVTNAGAALVGGITGAAKGIASLETPAPTKYIP